MNSNFSGKQIEAYATAFEEGDAIWCNGEWHEVVENEVNGDNRLTAHVYGNIYVINDGQSGNHYGFKVMGRSENPYRVTTLQDYELQGGEKLVWLGEGGYILGEVFETYVNENGKVVYTGGSGSVLPASSKWAVIPRYEQVAQSKEMKFNKGDKVLVNKTFTGVVKGIVNNEISGNLYGVAVINKYGQERTYNFLEEDLELYIEEPKARRVDSFESETKAIVDELHETLVRKNADYGDSFTKSYEKWGIVSAIIRMEDKFNRLNQLYDKDSSEVEESLYDTVLDLAGYAILTARELKKEKEQ